MTPSPSCQKEPGANPKPEEGAINQTLLPIIPAGATPINDRVGVFNQDGHWIYLVGMHPVYRHVAGDLRSFRLTVAQLVDSGALSARAARASVFGAWTS